MISFRDLKDAYERNWADLHIRKERAEEVRKEANRLLKGKAAYEKVEAKTGVPWWFVGLCHYRECHYNFNTYLGNGQPLNRVTTIVPKGRGPFLGPDAFVVGAVDALRLEGFLGSSDWSIARTLFRLEGFNGYGYHPRGVNSPYLYGGSTVYGPPEARAGKFLTDYVFDASFVEKQLGTAPILKALMELDPSINFDGVSPMSISTEPDDELAQTNLQVQESLNKLDTSPRLAEDGKNGPRTKAAISRFQQESGLTDTGLPDAATIAAMAQKSLLTTDQIPLTSPLREIIQRLGNLEQAVRPSTTDMSKPPTDPIGLIERLLPIIQKVNPKPEMTPSATGSPNVDQLQKAIDLLTAILATSKDDEPSLGQANGALGAPTSRREEFTESTEKRQINAWIEDGKPPLEKERTYRLGINIGKLRQYALASRGLTMINWEDKGNLELLIVISGHGLSVKPREQPLRLAKTGDTRAVFFAITPTNSASLLLRISLYLAHELTLLEEFEIPIKVRDAVRVA
jgi:lysozyme family protein/peptidoglycan hydrolase-like protein with peptidoglycan-binding domain